VQAQPLAIVTINYVLINYQYYDGDLFVFFFINSVLRGITILSVTILLKPLIFLLVTWLLAAILLLFFSFL
jgi:hypothetical protein